MNERLNDKKLDQLLKSLISDATPDEAMINEIADSPTVWWAVQRNIRVGKESAREPWPPIAKLLRFAAIGVPVTAGVLLAATYFFGTRGIVNEINTGNASLVTSTRTTSDFRAVTDTVSKSISSGGLEEKKPLNAVRTSGSKPAVSRNKTAAAYRKETPKASKQFASNEVKSDFIALTYARNPESGQIVRVKVPRSMMVTLGLVASVDRPSSMVDAEVLVGDDGTTHSIRFIR